MSIWMWIIPYCILKCNNSLDFFQLQSQMHHYLPSENIETRNPFDFTFLAQFSLHQSIEFRKGPRKKANSKQFIFLAQFNF